MSSPRRAAFVAVGSEMLRSERVDTNSFKAAELLQPCGFVFVEKRVLEDDEEAIAAAVEELRHRVELIVFSGGLGPTADDVTREGVARGLGREVRRDPSLEAMLTARYRAHDRAIPAAALRMSNVVTGAEVLRNPYGTAPGQLLETEGTMVVLLPGVPRELEEIVTTYLVPRWRSEGGLSARILHVGGVYESAVEDKVSPLYDRFGRERITILAARGIVHLILTASGRDAGARLDEMESAFSAVLGPAVFGRDHETLAGAVLGHLRAKKWRLATAESCTGGMIGALLTGVAGASDVYVGGVVSYANEVKESLLGVPADLLAAHGAVSAEVAERMAAGARGLGAECGLAVTGIAGPSGGTEAKPVGTVHMAVSTPEGARRSQHRFPGDRHLVRELAANFSLDLLRRALEET